MKKDEIIQVILEFYPLVEAIYIFGSYGTENEREHSDADIAILLPIPEAKSSGELTLSDCKVKLEEILKKDVDLINLRLANTVFQKEIIFTGRMIYRVSSSAIELFEMLVISYYQKLNEERADILLEVQKSRRILPE